MEGKYINRVMLNKEIDKNTYPGVLPVVQYLLQKKSISFTRDVTFLVGENGTGKSTLLEAIAVAYGFNAEGGSKNFRFSTNSTHSSLHEYITLSRAKYPEDGFFFRAESFYNVATNIEDLDRASSSPSLIKSYGGVSLHQQSHGESFLALVQKRFRGNGMYLLDEPEAALSPSRLLTLMAEIHALVKKDSQFIIATHSPILMTFPNAQIYQLTTDNVESVPYEQTEHYQLSKRFLENPEQILRYLLDG